MLHLKHYSSDQTVWQKHKRPLKFYLGTAQRCESQPVNHSMQNHLSGKIIRGQGRRIKAHGTAPWQHGLWPRTQFCSKGLLKIPEIFLQITLCLNFLILFLASKV